MQTKKNLHITFALIITIVMAYIFFKIDKAAFIQLFVLKSNVLSEIIPWQFFTYVFYFPENIVFFFFNVMIFFYFASTLESLWGSVHFGIYLLIIILSRSVSSFLFGPLPVIGHWSLYLCLMIAFGFNMPDERIYLFFVIPIRVKTLAIVSAVFVPIQIVASIVYPSGIEGILRVPLSLGSLVSGILSYSALLIYFPKIFTKKEIRIDKIIVDIKKNIKNIENKMENEDIKNQNKKIVEIYKKIDNNEILSQNEKDLLSTVEADYNDLCEDEDFNEEDDYCLNCEKFEKCIKRRRG